MLGSNPVPVVCSWESYLLSECVLKWEGSFLKWEGKTHLAKLWGGLT